MARMGRSAHCGSGGENYELLGKGRIRFEGIPYLSLVHDMDHYLDPFENSTVAGEGLEAEHRSKSALGTPMFLLDASFQVLAPANPVRLQPLSGTILPSIHGVEGDNRLSVDLTAVDDFAVGPAVMLKRSPEEALHRRQIARLGEPELSLLGDAVDGAIEIHPLASLGNFSTDHLPVTLRSSRFRPSSNRGEKQTAIPPAIEMSQ
nr:hypothetical protein [Mesorhizobium sp.]